MTLRFPTPVDEQLFLSQYWQRKALVLPKGLDDGISALMDAVTPEDLAALACADNAEARICHSAGPATQWKLQHGPFDEEDFAGLPATHWTLLLQDVDKFVPAITELLRQFNFLPSWRIDDVMISYAAPGGTVGPHIDQYDVFLIQGSGTRRWETGKSDGSYLPDIPLRVLEQFEVEHHWQLNSGDVLYLPPGLAHHGYSDVPCMTLSVGFRAPSLQELILSQAEHRAEQAQGHYEDSDLSLDEADDGLISKAAVERALTLLQGQPESAAQAVRWFGQLVTENKPWLQPGPPEALETAAQFTSRLQRGEQLQKHPSARMAHSHLADQALLFVDGTAWPLPAGSQSLLAAMCRGDAITAASGDDVGLLLYQLYCEGKIYWCNEH